jgi:riboflavin biosynthesis pyrimidine reductase
VDRLREIKAETREDLLVAAGPGLLATLLDHGLVDDLEILVLPVVAGQGARQVGALARRQPLALAEARPLASGAVVLRYHVKALAS